MCLSTIYNKEPSKSNALLRNVQRLLMEPDGLHCFDILENEKVFPGKLVSVDLVEGRVIIDLEA